MISYPFGVEGVMTRLLESGPGDGAAVVLVHGVGARADRWVRNVDVLGQAGYHVFAVDLPGHGFAEKGDHVPCTSPALARFLQSTLDELGITQVALIGTSLGGHIAATVACFDPARISALMLVGAVGIVPIGPTVRARVQQVLGDATAAGIEAKLRGLVYDDSIVTEEWVREEVAIANSPGALIGLARLADYFGNHLDEDVVGERLAPPRTRFPILLAWGEEDRSIPLEVGQRAHALLSGSTLSVISQAAHAPYLEQPNDFNSLCLEFLDARLKDSHGGDA